MYGKEGNGTDLSAQQVLGQKVTDNSHRHAHPTTHGRQQQIHSGSHELILPFQWLILRVLGLGAGTGAKMTERKERESEKGTPGRLHVGSILYGYENNNVNRLKKAHRTEKKQAQAVDLIRPVDHQSNPLCACFCPIPFPESLLGG